MPSTTRAIGASVLLLGAYVAPLAAQDKPQLLDRYLTARAALGQFNGTVLIAHDGRVLLEKGYGLANVEHRVPAAADTRYAIASITKNFTSAGILRLQEEGKLRFTDSLCHWVTSCPDAWKPVTISQLMHHTSGIPDYEEALELGSQPYMDYMRQSGSAERIFANARTKPLDFAPGSKFHYSNTAYILLGTIIEKASGKSYEEYLAEHVLKPAGVGDMQFGPGDAIIPRLASGYTRRDSAFAEVEAGVTLDEKTLRSENLLPLDGPHGDAKLIATAHDLWRWTQALMDSTALSPASIREMFTPGLGNYGTGWFIGERWGMRNANHSGSLPGHTSLIEFYPDSRTTLVMFTNTTNVRMSITMRDLAAIVFDKPYDLPVARTLRAYDRSAAAPYAGTYALDDGTKAIVSADSAMLRVQIPGRFTAGAFPMGVDEFYAPFFDNTVKFARDANGRPERIMLRINGATLAGVRQP